MSRSATIRDRARTVGRLVFGDRHGLVLWLGLLCWFGLTWRVGFFIQDTYATANTLVALADGQLHVTRIPYSLTLGSQPGLHRYDGLLYGRNYGQLALAVPLVWALEALAVVVDPRLLLAGLWAGVALVFVGQLDRLDTVDAGWIRPMGGLVVAVLFVATLPVATDLDTDRLALAAYQLSTMLAAAAAGLAMYRLVSEFHGRRLGLVAGVALGVATPVGFWATIPKRHTLVAALTLWAVYAFAVSRRREGRTALVARAFAYGFAGFVTWTHAFEAFFLVGTLAVVDLATARRTDTRTLAVLGAALLLATAPMLATNYAISGNPAEPPRLLPNVEGGDVEFSPSADGGTDAPGGDSGGPAADGSAGTSSESGGGERVGRDSDGGFLSTARDTAGPVSEFVVGAVVDGVATLGNPTQMWHTFVRSGHIPGIPYRLNSYEVIELTVLESTPILGALLALPALVGRRLREDGRDALARVDPRTLSPIRQTDLLVVAVAAVLTVVYLSRALTYSQLTVRYLHPMVPLATYGVCRIPAVRTAATEATGRLVGSYLVSLAFALAVVLGGIAGLELALGEAVQYHALWNLAAAAVGGAVVVAHTLAPDRISPRTVAAGLALPAGFATAFLLLSGLVYFDYGTYAFDLVRVVADVLPTL
ncbi:hypothetical protein [Haloarcula marina]|uniref:hypothetical protein n=1 Tax=Haloarcula marina TaxID=2961574 RepID=UPI0020B705CE|nr:hypothetical protein [Halomicroarcula marina]